MRRRLWGFVRKLLVTVVVVVAVLAVLHRLLATQVVRDWLLGVIESRVAATGADLQATELVAEAYPPSVMLHNVRVSADGVSAEMDRLRVELAGVRLRERVVELGAVDASGVRVAVDVGAVRGTGVEERSRRGFELSVRQLDVRAIEVVGRSVTEGLDVVARDLEARWSAGDRGLSGAVTTGETTFKVRGLEDIEIELAARFEAMERFDVTSWWARGAGLELEGEGGFVPGAGAWARAHGWFDAAEIDRLTRARAQLGGRVRVDVELDTRHEEFLELQLWAPELQAVGFAAESVTGRVALGSDEIRAQLDSARFADGQLEGDYRLTGLGGRFAHSVRFSGSDLSLARFLDAIRVPPAGLAARFDADAKVAWEGRAIWQGKGNGRAWLEPESDGVPVEGWLNVALTPDGLLRMHGPHLTVGSAAVSWEGPLTIDAWQPAWSIHVETPSLAEIVPVVESWIGSQVIPPMVDGAGVIDVLLSGPWQRLHTQLRLEAVPLTIGPIVIDRATTDLTIGDEQAIVNEAAFRIGDGSGEVEGWMTWTPSVGEEQLHLGLQAHNIPLERMAGWVDESAEVSGVVSFAGPIRGAFAAPRGSWAVGLMDVAFQGVELGDGSAQLELDDETFQLRDLAFPQGLNAAVAWNVATGKLTGRGAWSAMPMAAVLGEDVARWAGSPADVELSWDWLPGISMVGEGRLESPLASVAIILDPDAVVVEGDLDGVVEAEARLVRSEDGMFRGSGEVDVVSAAELSRRLAPGGEVPLTGSFSSPIEVTWQPGELPQVNGLVRSVQLRLDERPMQLIEPAEYVVSASEVRVDGVYLALGEAELFARGRVGADGDLSGNISGNADAVFLRYFVPGWEPAGGVRGIVELLGTVRRPQVEGIVEVDHASFRLPESRTVFSNISGVALLAPGEIVLDGVGFRGLQGQSTGAGTIRVRENVVELDLYGEAEGVRFEVLAGLSARMRGAWRLRGPVDDLMLSGDLEVERAILRRNDDLASLILEWVEDAGGPTQVGVLDLDVSVEADRTIEARIPFMQVVASAQLEISGSETQPGAVGRIVFQEGGSFTFQGARYELDRFEMVFSDPTEIDPRIELQARTWVENYQITVRLDGTMDRLVPSFTSDPPLPEADVISLLALGRRDESLGAVGVGAGVASAILTRQLNAELERRARALLSLDQVRVDPFTEVSTGNPTARVTVVKQFSPAWTVILQTNLSSNREEVITSRWRLGSGVFVEATRDTDGTYAVDLKLRRRY